MKVDNIEKTPLTLGDVDLRLWEDIDLRLWRDGDISIHTQSLQFCHLVGGYGLACMHHQDTEEYEQILAECKKIHQSFKRIAEINRRGRI